MPDVLMHVNYFEDGYTVAETFDKVLEYGYDGVELRGWPRYDETLEDYLDDVEKQMQRTGVSKVVLSLRGHFMDPDANARKAGAEMLTYVLERGLDMGCRTFNASCGMLVAPGADHRQPRKRGSYYADAHHWQWAAEAYGQVASVAEQRGAKIAFETHGGYIHDLAKPTKKLLDMIGSDAVGANLDMGNIILHPEGESPEQALEILNGRIYHVHLKNMLRLRGEGFAAVGLAEGCIDTRKFLRMLKEQGYSHSICIEAPRPGDRDYFAASDLAYTRSLLQYLDWEEQSGRDTVVNLSAVPDARMLPSG
jgi:sugar phosphate isomerase/epimerase